MDKECDKSKFTKKGAKTALNYIRDTRFGRKQYRKEVRSYHCPLCGSWHLTSKKDEGWTPQIELPKIFLRPEWEELIKSYDV